MAPVTTRLRISRRAFAVSHERLDCDAEPKVHYDAHGRQIRGFLVLLTCTFVRARKLATCRMQKLNCIER